MFYITEAFLLAHDLAYSKHSAVIAAFGQRFIKTGIVPQEFHRYLIEGASIRNIGDYDTHAQLSPEDAAEQLDRSARFLDLAQSHLGPLPNEET